MNASEKIYVSGFWCDTAENNWKTGEDPAGRGSGWGHKDVGFDTSQGFDTVGQALAAVCESNCFGYVKENWTAFGKDCGEDFGRFDGDFLVDNENSEASPGEIEEWEKGERRLWNCHIHVYLEIRTVRKFTLEDAEGF